MFETVVLQCDKGFSVHEAHSWRHGFLNLRKRTCNGVTQKGYDSLMAKVANHNARLKPKHHKHRLEYKPSQKHLWVNPFRYVWVCKDQSCNHVISTEKSEFKHALLSEHVYHAQQVRVFHKPWPSS